MSQPSESYLKVPYDLRTAKQIERRMIVDALQILSRSNFTIGDYQYTGLGSIFFVDFVLFHKLLGIHRMLSVEASHKIRKRVKFNCPYGNIRLEFGQIRDFISKLEKDLKHIIWFDYDYALDGDVMTDVVLASSELSCGSILLITVDLELPKHKKGEEEREETRWTPEDRIKYFQKEASNFFALEWDVTDFVQSKMPAINTSLIQNAIRKGLAGRSEIEFLPLFNFVYADGHKMLTLGGVIGGGTEKRFLESCDFERALYIRRDLKDPPYEIKVPIITRKERLHLDSAMPCEDNWMPKQFELSDEAIKTYKEIYRFYPAYAELLL